MIHPNQSIEELYSLLYYSNAAIEQLERFHASQVKSHNNTDELVGRHPIVVARTMDSLSDQYDDDVIDLSSLGIGVEVIQSTLRVARERQKQIIKALESHGVAVYDDPI